MYGYAGRILHVDLSTGKTRVEKLNEEIAKKYIGGIGLGMRLWLDNSKPGVEPFSPGKPPHLDRWSYCRNNVANSWKRACFRF